MNHQKIIAVSENLIEYGFYGLIFFVPISNAFIESFAGFVFLGFIIKKTMTKDFASFKVDAEVFWLLLILFVFNTLSLVNSGPFIFKSLSALFFKWAEYFLLFAIAIDHFRDRKLIKRFLYVFLVSIILVGLSALSQKLLGVEFFRGRSLVGVAVTGSFDNPNDFSAYLICCLPVLLSLSYWKGKKNIIAIVSFVASGIAFVALLLTYSRGGWMGFFFGLVIAIFLFAKKKLPTAVLVFFLISVLPTASLIAKIQSSFGVNQPVSVVVGNPFAARVEHSFGPGGDSQRFVIWHGTFEMIKENPILGKGLGTFMSYFEQYIPDIGIFYTHNCYLQMWAESGIFTLIAFLVLVSFILCRGACVALRNRFDNFGFLLSGLTAGLSAFLIASFFDTQLYSLQLSVLFWTMLGVTVAVQRILLDESEYA